MALQIGRFGVDLIAGQYANVEQVKDAAERLSIVGYVSVASQSETEVLRQQLLGYLAEEDETFVPVLWSENAAVDGYYRVVAGDFTTDSGLQTLGYARFTATLERVQSFSAPLMELGVMGAVRASENQVITNWFKNPTFDGASAPVNQSNVTASIATYLGSSMARAVCTSTASASMRLMPNADRPAAVAGETWYAVASFYNAEVSSLNFQFVMRFYDTAGATLGTQLSAATGGIQAIAGGGSAVMVVSAVAPSGAASVSIAAQRDGTGGATDTFYADNVYLSKDQPLIDVGRFSGASVDSSGYDFAWTSTANASPSTCTLTWTSDTAIPQSGLPGPSVSLQAISSAGVYSNPPMVDTAIDGGTVRMIEPTNGESLVEFRLDPADFYDGAATLTLDGHVVTGRQIPNDPDGWVLSNGRFEVRPKAGETAVEIRQFASGVWSAWQSIAFRAQPDSIDAVLWLGLNSFSDPHAMTVLRNSPECVIIRLHTTFAFTTGSLPTLYYELMGTVDLSLRRGQPFVAAEVKLSAPAKLGVAVNGFASAEPFNHGWYLASTGVFAESPKAVVVDGTSPAGIKTSTSLTAAPFGIGFTQSPAQLPITRSAYPHLHYRWAATERMRVVA